MIQEIEFKLYRNFKSFLIHFSKHTFVCKTIFIFRLFLEDDTYSMPVIIYMFPYFFHSSYITFILCIDNSTEIQDCRDIFLQVSKKYSTLQIADRYCNIFTFLPFTHRLKSLFICGLVRISQRNNNIFVTVKQW